jgi:glycosyltransferase involved in cell wall biosynthesis
LITYSHPPQVQLSWLHRRPLLSLPEGGQVALDRTLLTLWQAADAHTLDEILVSIPDPSMPPEAVRAAIACLAEAGLLNREGGDSPTLPVETQNIASRRPPEEEFSARQDVWRVSIPALGVVSAIIVAYNSQQWLNDCLSSLLAQSVPPQEIILVDNGSDQNPAQWLSAHYPSVQLLRLETARGLAYALNRGIELAGGGYFLLLNPDITLQPDALEQLLRIAQAHPDCAAVGPMLRFSWARAFLNGLGNQVNAFSWGTDNGLGHLDLDQFDTWSELPSACFAAVLISRSAWDTIGTLDEGFSMYYEDLEWCYRARLLGQKILAAPQAVVYHAQGQWTHTGQGAGISPQKLANVTVGRLRFALRLWCAPTLWRSLSSYALADLGLIIRGLLRFKLAESRAVLRGWGRFLRSIPTIRRERRLLQARRVLSDKQILALHRESPPPLIWRGLPELTWESITQSYIPLHQAQRIKPMPEIPHPTPRLLIISHDIVAEKMAGPGMRYLEMARALSAHLPVTLAIPNQTNLTVPDVTLAAYRFDQPASLQQLAQESDVILLSSFILDKFPFLTGLPARRVVDLYDPLVLENLHLYQGEPLDIQTSLNDQAVQSMNRLVALGDFFICGNERQRDFWLGVLAANGRLNPHTFAQDAGLRSLIDVVGVGFPDRPPQGHPLLSGVHPAIPPDAQIVLWGGGLWDWLDPLTLIHSWPAVLARFPKARLVMLGTRHPNPTVPPHAMAARAESLAESLGEKDRTIFFIEWLSYEDRESLLCEANVGVALHPLHLETRYSIRTRVLDYLWAGLPVLVTEGDVTSQWVAQGGLGRVIPPLDSAAASQALIELLSQPKSAWAPAFAGVRETHTWLRVIAPLRQYCLSGTPAPDRNAGRSSPPGSRPAWHSNLARARFIWRREGFRALLHRLRRYLQWRISRF